MASIDNCKAEIEASLGRALTASEKKVVSRAAAKVKVRVDAAGGTPASADAALKAYIAERNIIKAAKEMQAASRERAMSGLKARLEDAGDFTTKAPGQVLQSLLISSLKKFKGAANSLGHAITHGTDQRSQMFFNALHREGLTEYAFDPADQENIWKAMDALQRGEDASKFGPRAAKTAEVFKKNADLLQFDKRDAGIPVGKLKDWVGPQQHDMYALGRAGGNRFGSDASAAQWIKDVAPRIDWDRSFSGEFTASEDSLRTKRLSELWSQFVSGNHLKYGGYDPVKGREIVFKDVNAAYSYNKLYGNGRTLAENIHTNIRTGARDIEINKMFGNSPETTFNQLASDLEKRLNEDEAMKPDDRRRALEQIATAKRKARDYWLPSLLDGLANPEHGGVAQWVGAARSVTNVMAAAGASITLPGDIPLAMNLMARYGGRQMRGYLSSVSKATKWMGAFSKEDRMRIAASGEILLQDATRPLTHAHMDSSVPGAIHRLESGLMKYAGHMGWDDRMGVNALAHWGADHWFDRGRAFDALLPGQQDGLSRFGIGPKEWDVIRQQTPLDVNSTVKAFTPRGVRNMDLEQFKSLADPGTSDAILRRLRTEVADKYRNFMGEMTYRSKSAPDAEMKAIVLHGTRSGTMLGEAVRSFNSLKSWTYNLMRNHFGAMVAGDANPENVGWSKMMWNFAKGSGGDAGGRVAMTKFISNNLAFGMLIAQLGLLRNGQAPIIPDTPEKAAQLLMLGFARQGMGMYSDLLLAQLRRPDQSIYETIGDSFGPLIGDAADVTQAAGRVVSNGAQYATNSDYSGNKFWKAFARSEGQVARVGYSLIPGSNFAYTKFATDWFLKDNLLDAINPGYKDRLAKKAQQASTPFWLANP